MMSGLIKEWHFTLYIWLSLLESGNCLEIELSLSKGGAARVWDSPLNSAMKQALSR